MVQSLKRDLRSASAKATQPGSSEASSSALDSANSTISPLSMSSGMSSARIQPKLKVNQAGDRYEQEADAVAAAVVGSKSAPLPQPDSNRDTIQRMPEETEEDIVQRKGAGSPTVSPVTASAIRNPGAGSPLPSTIRSRVEPHVKANLSGVRLHTDAKAQRATTNLNARAFTHRNHIFLNRSESSSDVKLMAHELTHTVQQGAVPRTSASTTSREKEQTQSKPQLASPLSTEKRVQPFETVSAPPEIKETEAEAKQAEALFAPGPVSEVAEKDKAPRSPEADPAFQAVRQRSKGIAKKQQKHAPAATEAAKAQAAAVSPVGELKSQAQDQQIQSLDKQEPGTFSADQFVTLLMQKVAAIVPKDEKSALDPKRKSKIETVKQSVATDVTQEKDRASSAIAQKTKEKPTTQGLTPRVAKPLTKIKAGPKPANLKASQAAPKAKTHIEVTQPLQQQNQQLQQQMSAADITDQQLANANEPEFTEALTAKQAAHTHTKTGPVAYRETEKTLLTGAENEAQVTGQKQTDAMHSQRGKLLSEAKSQQVAAKAKDEQARAKVVKDINGIYETTKSSVTTILDGLDKEVSKRFDAAAKVADKKFKEEVEKGTKAFRKDRYGAWYSALGFARRIKDFFGDLPPRLNAVYVKARDFYVDTMRESLKEIGAYVAQQLIAAKQKVTDGKKKIATYVDGLSPALKQVGETAAGNIQQKFDQLGEQVNSKQGQLVDSLAKKYAKNLKGVDGHLNKLREENTGLIAKAAKYAKGVWKIIQNLRKTLLSVLAKASATIDAILKNPIRFVNLLIKGVTQGFNNFKDKLLKHFQAGLIGWLTGALGPMGIEIPKDVFSLKGIFSLVTQVLGLTWAFVRKKAVKLFGEKTVAAMEKSVEIIQILRKDGVGGLWKHLKDQFTDLKASVMGQIKELLMVQVLQAGVKWILGLLNPASAFVKAAMLIYDIVMFFVNQGSQIVELVKAVVDGISAIASGKVGAIAKAVEGALARSVPVLIGLLAAALGISGLSRKIQEIFRQIRKRFENALYKMLLKVRARFKKTVKSGRSDSKLLRWWKKEEKLHTKDGKYHILFFTLGDRKNYTLMISSTKMAVVKQLSRWASIKPLPDEAVSPLSQARRINRELDTLPANRKTNKKSQEQGLNKRVDNNLKKLSNILKKLYPIFNSREKDHKTIASEITVHLKRGTQSRRPYKEMRAQKVQQAKHLQERYQKELKPGIKLTISFSPEAEDKKDGNLDILIRIAPNTLSEPVKVTTLAGEKLRLAVMLAVEVQQLRSTKYQQQVHHHSKDIEKHVQRLDTVITSVTDFLRNIANVSEEARQTKEVPLSDSDRSLLLTTRTSLRQVGQKNKYTRSKFGEIVSNSKSMLGVAETSREKARRLIIPSFDDNILQSINSISDRKLKDALQHIIGQKYSALSNEFSKRDGDKVIDSLLHQHLGVNIASASFTGIVKGKKIKVQLTTQSGNRAPVFYTLGENTDVLEISVEQLEIDSSFIPIVEVLAGHSVKGEGAYVHTLQSRNNSVDSERKILLALKKILFEKHGIDNIQDFRGGEFLVYTERDACKGCKHNIFSLFANTNISTHIAYEVDYESKFASILDQSDHTLITVLDKYRNSKVDPHLQKILERMRR